MTKLSTIGAEARRVLRNTPESRLQALQRSLVALCETHWLEMRGPEPASRLAKALWAVRPHLADLFVHLYGVTDPRLVELLEHLTPQRALAALVLAEIERGDAEGALGAHTALQIFESPAARAVHVGATLLPTAAHEPGARLKHAHRPALWRAVVGFALQTGRWDPKAVEAGLRVVAQAQADPGRQAGDPGLQAILELLQELGVVLLSVGEDRLRYALRGEIRDPVGFKHLADILAEGRQTQGL